MSYIFKIYCDVTKLSRPKICRFIDIGEKFDRVGKEGRLNKIVIKKENWVGKILIGLIKDEVMKINGFS